MTESKNEVLQPASPSLCPFMPPVVMPGRIHGDVAIRPIPCLGKRDPIKGGGCAAWALCQETPETLAASHRTGRADHVPRKEQEIVFALVIALAVKVLDVRAQCGP